MSQISEARILSLAKDHFARITKFGSPHYAGKPSDVVAFARALLEELPRRSTDAELQA